MLKGLVDIPVYPLKGYSLTIPIAQEDGAPVSTILDETYKIAITRFDQRIRVGGMAEIVGFNKALLQPRRETHGDGGARSVPRGGHVEQATFWTGLLPMTPDGTPVVGRTAYKNLWLNTGHGTLAGPWPAAPGSYQRSDLRPHAGDPTTIWRLPATAPVLPRRACSTCTAHTTKELA